MINMSRNLIQWSPIGELDKLFEGELWSDTDFSLPVDIYEKDNDVIVEVPVAGVDPEKIEVTVKDNILTIAGKTEKKEEVKRENYYRKEVREGSFSRSVALPVNVKDDQAEASYKRGVLTIKLPKVEEAKAKKIAIKTNE